LGSRIKSIFTLSLLSYKLRLAAPALIVTLRLLLIYLPFGTRLFSTTPRTIGELGLMLAGASLIFWAVELQKLGIRWREKVATPATFLADLTSAPAAGRLVAARE
jgi:Ca2+-transporting ATPase